MRKRKIKKVFCEGLKKFNSFNPTTRVVIIVFLMILISYGAISVSAYTWTPPDSSQAIDPLTGLPKGNVANPVNTGPTEQTKTGKLNLGGLTVNGTITGLSGFNVSYPNSGVYGDPGTDGIFSRINIDSFHTNGNNAGQLYIEGRAIDANTAIVIGGGYAGGQTAKSVGIGKVPTGVQKLDVDGSLNATQYCINGANCITAWPTGGGGTPSGISGSGTANYGVKWTGATTVGNSIIFDNGTNVGIGTSSPTVKLDVGGAVKGTQLCIGSDCRSNWPSGGVSQWTTSGSNIYYNTGNVGIGTTTLNVAKLQVNASTSIEGIRIISSNYSPFVIRNSVNNTDFLRVDQNGNVAITGGLRVNGAEVCLSTGKTPSGASCTVGIPSSSSVQLLMRIKGSGNRGESCKDWLTRIGFPSSDYDVYLQSLGERPGTTDVTPFEAKNSQCVYARDGSYGSSVFGGLQSWTYSNSGSWPVSEWLSDDIGSYNRFIFTTYVAKK